MWPNTIIPHGSKNEFEQIIINGSKTSFYHDLRQTKRVWINNIIFTVPKLSVSLGSQVRCNSTNSKLKATTYLKELDWSISAAPKKDMITCKLQHTPRNNWLSHWCRALSSAYSELDLSLLRPINSECETNWPASNRQWTYCDLQSQPAAHRESVCCSVSGFIQKPAAHRES